MDYEIAIVGGGPAGAATALFLCAEDPALATRIVVLDKATFPRDKICAGALGGRADRQLASIGVHIDVPSVRVDGLCVRTGSGELTARHTHGIGRVVRRKAFDAALLDAVRERGVAVLEGTRVSGLTRLASRVDIATSRGKLQVRAVVGADGVGSIVRRALGFSGGDYRAQVVEVDTDSDDADAAMDLLSFDLSDRSIHGYAWDFPTLVHGQRLVCRGVYVLTRGLGGNHRDASVLLRERLQRRGIATNSPFKRFAERGLSLYEPLSGDRVILVGEAAGIDPVLGEGIPQAIFYGKMAARYLAGCMRAQAFHFQGYRRAMRATRVGVDLRVRAVALDVVYGRTRPRIERWITSSQALATAGMHYFAGQRVPRAALARAAFDLLTTR